MRISKSFLRGFLVGLTVVSLAACATRIDTRGTMIDPESVAKIKPGESNRTDVAQLLGTPSTVSNFNNDAWYYINNRTETFAFFAPTVEDRQVLVVRFDKDGRVESLNKLGLADGKDVDLVERTTPTAGNEMTVMQQFFGNLGKFNPTGTSRPTVPTGQGGY
jgi:outer membrane protein assembly factor BamE (lipoprotein component of BamABCDE complex)